MAIYTYTCSVCGATYESHHPLRSLSCRSCLNPSLVLDPLTVAVYRDDTGRYTETECDIDNIVEIAVPSALLRQWFDEYIYNDYKDCVPLWARGDRDDTFTAWYEDYTADATIGLVRWLANHSFYITRPDATFRCDLTEQDLEELMEGKTHPDRHDWGVASLELGNVALELNITSEESETTEDAVDIWADYFVCVRDKTGEWNSIGYLDYDDITMVDVIWESDNWRDQLQADMYYVLLNLLDGRVKWPDNKYHSDTHLDNDIDLEDFSAAICAKVRLPKQDPSPAMDNVKAVASALSSVMDEISTRARELAPAIDALARDIDPYGYRGFEDFCADRGDSTVAVTEEDLLDGNTMAYEEWLLNVVGDDTNDLSARAEAARLLSELFDLIKLF